MSLIFWAVTVIPATCYVLLMLYYFRHWNQLPKIVQDIDFQPKTAFSVVIAARNEQQNIRHCLSALTACRYPVHLLEIIVVNDHSTDETAAVVHDFMAKNATGVSIHLLHPESGSGKKNAISTGIGHAAHPFIACTDADCEPPENWLLLLAQVFEKQSPKMIAGPVVFHREKKNSGMVSIAGPAGHDGSDGRRHPVGQPASGQWCQYRLPQSGIRRCERF